MALADDTLEYLNAMSDARGLRNKLQQGYFGSEALAAANKLVEELDIEWAKRVGMAAEGIH